MRPAPGHRIAWRVGLFLREVCTSQRGSGWYGEPAVPTICYHRRGRPIDRTKTLQSQGSAPACSLTAQMDFVQWFPANGPALADGHGSAAGWLRKGPHEAIWLRASNKHESERQDAQDTLTTSPGHGYRSKAEKEGAKQLPLSVVLVLATPIPPSRSGRRTPQQQPSHLPGRGGGHLHKDAKPCLSFPAQTRRVLPAHASPLPFANPHEIFNYILRPPFLTLGLATAWPLLWPPRPQARPEGRVPGSRRVATGSRPVSTYYPPSPTRPLPQILDLLLSAPLAGVANLASATASLGPGRRRHPLRPGEGERHSPGPRAADGSLAPACDAGKSCRVAHTRLPA